MMWTSKNMKAPREEKIDDQLNSFESSGQFLQDLSNQGGLVNRSKSERKSTNRDLQDEVTDQLTSIETYREQSQQAEGILAHLERAANIVGYSYDQQLNHPQIVNNLQGLSINFNSPLIQNDPQKISNNPEFDFQKGIDKHRQIFNSIDPAILSMNMKQNDNIPKLNSNGFQEFSLFNQNNTSSNSIINYNNLVNNKLISRQNYRKSFHDYSFVKSLLKDNPPQENNKNSKGHGETIQPIGSATIVDSEHNFPITQQIEVKKNINDSNNSKNKNNNNNNNPSINSNSQKGQGGFESALSISPSQVIQQQKSLKYTTLFIIKRFISRIKKLIASNRFKDLKTHHLQLINDLSHDPKCLLDSTMQSGQSTKLIVLKQGYAERITKMMNFGMIYDRYLKQIVVSSQSNFSICFEIVLLFTVCIQMYLVPFILCFKLEESTFFDTLVISAFPIFMSEIFLRCVTSYYKEGLEVRKQQKILKRYLKTHFLGDFITLLALAISFQSGTTWISLVFLLKIKRIPKLINQIDDHFQLEFRFPIAFELLKLFLLISSIAHFCGCGFCFLGQSEIDNNENSWFKAKQISSGDWSEKYLYGLYFSFITMITVGYGDITPQTNKEIMYVLFMTLISTGTFGYSINTIGSIFREMQVRKSELKKQKHNISSYMRSRNISKTVQIKVQKELEHYQQRQQQDGQNGDSILSQLSQDVKNSVKREYYGRILEKYKLLKLNFSNEFICQLSLKLKEMFLSPDEAILQQGELMNKILCLVSGELIAFVESPKNKFNHIPIGKIKKGEFSDQRPLFFEHNLGYGLKSAGICQIAYFTHEDFTMTLRSFPQEYEKFCMLRDNIQHQGIFIDLKCFCCGTFGHSTNNCNLVHLKMNDQNNLKREKDIKQVRLQFQRSLFSFNSLLKRSFTSEKLKSYRVNAIQEIIPFYKPFLGSKQQQDEVFFSRVPRITIQAGKTIVKIRDDIDEEDEEDEGYLYSGGDFLFSRENITGSPYEGKVVQFPSDLERSNLLPDRIQIQPLVFLLNNQQQSPQSVSFARIKKCSDVRRAESLDEKTSFPKVISHIPIEKDRNLCFIQTTSRLFHQQGTKHPIVQEFNSTNSSKKNVQVCKIEDGLTLSILGLRKQGSISSTSGLTQRNGSKVSSIKVKNTSSQRKINNIKVGNSNSIQFFNSISPFDVSGPLNVDSLNVFPNKQHNSTAFFADPSLFKQTYTDYCKKSVKKALLKYTSEKSGESRYESFLQNRFRKEQRKLSITTKKSSIKNVVNTVSSPNKTGFSPSPISNGISPFTDFNGSGKKSLDSMLMDIFLFGSSIQSFDSLKQYKIYFPHGNIKDIIDDLCGLQIEKIKQRKDIKRSFKQKVVKKLKRQNLNQQDASEVRISTTPLGAKSRKISHQLIREHLSVKNPLSDLTMNPQSDQSKKLNVVSGMINNNSFV